jgi:hypothetical protein
MTRLSIALASALTLLIGCGGAEPPAKTAAPAASAAGDLHPTCVQAFQRQRECTDTFIPALVALRVKLDKPAGIAETDAKDGRDALVATAMEEWKVDSTDAAIGTTCDKIVADMPPEQQDGMAAKGKACLATADCQAFVDCLIPMIEPMIAGGEH